MSDEVLLPMLSEESPAGGSTELALHSSLTEEPSLMGEPMCAQVNMDPILKYINTCNEKALTREQDAKRTAPLAQDDDPRVDVCIYFLSPHRVKPIDLKFMTELSALAPVVPVLAKADSMTTDELQHFRSGVKQALAQARPSVSLSNAPL